MVAVVPPELEELVELVELELVELVELVPEELEPEELLPVELELELELELVLVLSRSMSPLQPPKNKTERTIQGAQCFIDMMSNTSKKCVNLLKVRF